MTVRKINIYNSEISVIFGLRDDDYICLTDMVKAGDNSERTNIVIQNWMRRKDTISYLGVWENLHNPDFRSIEFDAIRNASGTNRFVLTAKEWIERTNAIGIIAKTGRYGGTYAHKDIAYHFGMWLSPEFNLLVVKEFQRLKEEEQKVLGWSAKRELAKINYHIHTDYAILYNLQVEAQAVCVPSLKHCLRSLWILYKLKGKGPRFWAKTDLEKKGFTDLAHEYYLVYEFDTGKSAEYRNLPSLVRGKQTTSPLCATWETLMEKGE